MNDSLIVFRSILYVRWNFPGVGILFLAWTVFPYMFEEGIEGKSDSPAFTDLFKVHLSRGKKGKKFFSCLSMWEVHFWGDEENSTRFHFFWKDSLCTRFMFPFSVTYLFLKEKCFGGSRWLFKGESEWGGSAKIGCKYSVVVVFSLSLSSRDGSSRRLPYKERKEKEKMFRTIKFRNSTLYIFLPSP